MGGAIAPPPPPGYATGEALLIWPAIKFIVLLQ